MPSNYDNITTESGGLQVVIAGGDISGLTFVNALEKAGIEYVLLAQQKRWSWGRIACVGDCVYRELKNTEDAVEKGKQGYDDIKAHLGNCQKRRDNPLPAVPSAATSLTRIHAPKTLKERIFAFGYFPIAGDL